MSQEKQEFLNYIKAAIARNEDKINLAFYQASNTVVLSKKILGSMSQSDFERLYEKLDAAAYNPNPKEVDLFIDIREDKLSIFNKSLLKAFVNANLPAVEIERFTPMMFKHITIKHILDNYCSTDKDFFKIFIHAHLDIKYLKGLGVLNKLKFSIEEKEEILLKLLEKYQEEVKKAPFIQSSVYTFIRNQFPESMWEQFKIFLPRHAYHLQLSTENKPYVTVIEKYCLSMQVDYQAIINKHAKLMKKSAIDDALLIINRALSKGKETLGLESIIALTTDPVPTYHLVSSNPIKAEKIMFVFSALVDDYVNLGRKNTDEFVSTLASTIFKHCLDFDTQHCASAENKVMRKKI